MKIRDIKIQVITQTYFWIKKVQTSILVQVYECLRSEQILHSCYLNKKMEFLSQRNSIIVKQLVQEIEEERFGLSVFRVSDECFNHLSYSSALHTGFEPTKPFSSLTTRIYSIHFRIKNFILISLLNAQTLLRGLRCRTIFLYFPHSIKIKF